MQVGEVCNRDVVITARDSSVAEVVELMRSHHVGDVIVADQSNGTNIPVGIITDRDIVLQILAEHVDLDAVSVGDVMSYELIVANESDELMTTVKEMQTRGVRRIPVVDAGGGLVGILAVDDVLELIAEQLNDVVGLISKEQLKERRVRT